MKQLLIFLILLFLTFNISSQNLCIGIYSGYSTYDLNNIRQMQQQALEYYSPLEIKSVENFPGSINYLLTLEYKTIKNYSWGLDITYFSTGGRNHLLDYSGEYKLDMLVDAYRLGALFKKSKRLNKNLSYYYNIKGGLVYSNFKFDEKVTINNIDTVDYNYNKESNAFFIEPDIGVSYFLGHNISIDANFGYQVDINSRFITKKDSYIYWSGFRFLVGINYNISGVIAKVIK